MDLIDKAEDLTEKLARELGFTNIIHPQQTTAAQAAATIPPAHAIPTTKENTMNLATIAADIEHGATSADNWMHTVLGTHVPALIAEVERYQNNPIVQELEALGETMLPPGDVAIITGIIRMAGRAAGQGTAPQQTDVTQIPAGQGPEGAQPAWQQQPAEGQQADVPADGNPSSDPRNR